MGEPGEAGWISITSGVSAFDGSPFCHVQWGKLTGQLTPGEVRAMALQWIEAAEAAQSDALIVAMLREDLGVDPGTAAGFLQELRRRRDVDDG